MYNIFMTICFIVIFISLGAINNTYFDNVWVEVSHNHEIKTPYFESKNGLIKDLK